MEFSFNWCEIKVNKNLKLKYFVVSSVLFFFLSFLSKYSLASENKVYLTESEVNSIETCLQKNPYTIQIYTDFEEKNISSKKILKTSNSEFSGLKFLILNLHPIYSQWYSGYLGLFANKSDAQKKMDQLLVKDLIPYDSFVYRLSDTQMNRIKIEIKKNSLDSLNTLAFASQILCPKTKTKVEVKKAEPSQSFQVKEKFQSAKKVKEKRNKKNQSPNIAHKEKFKLTSKFFFVDLLVPIYIYLIKIFAILDRSTKHKFFRQQILTCSMV